MFRFSPVIKIFPLNQEDIKVMHQNVFQKNPGGL